MTTITKSEPDKRKLDKLTHLVEGKGVFGRAEPAQTHPLSL
jgi:hypothetical protein